MCNRGRCACSLPHTALLCADTRSLHKASYSDMTIGSPATRCQCSQCIALFLIVLLVDVNADKLRVYCMCAHAFRNGVECDSLQVGAAAGTCDSAYVCGPRRSNLQHLSVAQCGTSVSLISIATRVGWWSAMINGKNVLGTCTIPNTLRQMSTLPQGC